MLAWRCSDRTGTGILLDVRVMKLAVKRLLPVLMGFALLLLSSTEGWSLPSCLGSYNWKTWTDCFGVWEKNGDKYVGEWKDDKFNGQGTFTFGPRSKWAGDKYVGEFKDDKRNGQGTYTFASGRIKEGIFKDDKFLYAQKVTPREVWQVEKRLRLDWLVTLTVLEEEKLIWLLEANW